MKLMQAKNPLLATFLFLAATHSAIHQSDMVSSNQACRPINITIAAEKDDCPVCMAITTTICSGYCSKCPNQFSIFDSIEKEPLEVAGSNMFGAIANHTYSNRQEMLWKPLFPSFNQKVCIYKEVQYETAFLQGCPPDVDPSFVYPVAVSCHCDLCNVDSTDCTVQGIGPETCSNQNLIA